jgi:hypothetical protein
MEETIFTLDARDNIYLDVVKDYFKLDKDRIHHEINGTFQELLSILNSKKINYQDLKGALIPHSDRREIAFVFDTLQIKSAWYGLPVFSNLIPLLDKKSSNSILCGDYIGKDQQAEKLHSVFFEHINSNKQIEYKHHTQFFIVYINNLTDTMVDNINSGLTTFSPYVGFFDLTYSSFIKTYLSTILVHLVVKCKTTIISEHEPDRSNDEDVNMHGYPFEENGYKCKSLQEMYFMLFLSYKIERKGFEGFESDTSFSLNAISKNVLDITDFSLLIEEDKLGYLLRAKEANLKRAGIINLTISELEQFVKNEISNNYIYNLTFLKEFGTVKFNIMIETKTKDTKESIRLNVALEYKAADKTLRLITMY